MGSEPSYEELLQKIASLEMEVAKGKQAEDEKKDLEIQLVQAQKMESLGTLAGGIAHDFNNILSPVIGYTEMMLSDIPEASLHQKYLFSILKATNRARDLVQQILTFSRQTKPERKSLKIQTVIKEALKLLRSSLPATIEIRQTIGDGYGQVKADPTQIHQMIMNLGTNAYHAMREGGGVLEVVLDEIKIGQDNQAAYPTLAIGSYLHLKVRDTGHGIDSADTKRIFDPYFTTKKAGEGTGLGLSLVDGIVKDHSGYITVQSVVGKGTVFHIYFPRIVTATSVPVAESRSISPRGDEHILLVDDEPQLLQMEQQLLENLGYRVTPQSSGLEALKLFNEAPDRYDIVITDMTMPHLTGDKLSEKLIDIRPDIPVILCSGFSELNIKKEMLSPGVRAFIVKPVAMNQMATTLRSVLDSSYKSIGDADRKMASAQSSRRQS